VEDTELRALYESLREMAGLSEPLSGDGVVHSDPYSLIKTVMEVKVQELRGLMVSPS
jgi:hypothetical protein